MKGPVGLWAIIGGTMTISLISPSFATPSAPATPEQGRAIYEQRCLDCHGPEGQLSVPSARQSRVCPHLGQVRSRVAEDHRQRLPAYRDARLEGLLVGR